MSSHLFIISWAPAPRDRPRFFTTKDGRARPYETKRNKNANAIMYMAVQQQLPADWQPLEGPLEVEIWAFREPLKAMPKKLFGIKLPTSAPDLDNYIKQLDTLNKLVWRDDSQIVDIYAHKRYAWSGVPRWEIEVREVADVDCRQGSLRNAG